MMTFLQVFRPVCLEAEAAPAAKELIPHFLILGSTSTLSLQMKPLLGSRSHLRLQKSSRWNMSLLQDSWGPPVAEGHRELCLLPEPFTGTFPPHQHPTKLLIFSIEKVEKVRPINFIKTQGLKNKQKSRKISRSFLGM